MCSDVGEYILEEITTSCRGINCRNWVGREETVVAAYIGSHCGYCDRVSDVVPGIKPFYIPLVVRA